jgi:hypothetical protein
MFANNVAVFFMVVGTLLIAMTIGTFRNHAAVSLDRHIESPQVSTSKIPSIGRIQVLNGCGIGGAADKVADFLRANKFDVKNKSNADNYNYPYTMVISRRTDMTIAQEIARVLSTDNIVLMRTEDTTYDVSVVIGPDYEERIR